ncbi:hypothetical protein [Fangia hongkongensis]|uniref:hypothetical protein n=1 Tax=Fangia hongkongensis TaxID=270495 RepID=UPI0003810306|nr:hypothetical protein [Fangia hongkongensis]MBK2125548.1 hypothetical protein [Fangia hongkongensis]
MSKFNISYNIIAIDRFSNVANRIKKQAESIKRSVSGVSANISKSNASLIKSFENTKSKIGKPINAPRINFNPARNSINNFSRWASNYAFKGFINSMNVIMPLMMIFAKPFKDMMSQQQAMSSMKINGVNASAMKSQAEKLSKSTAFSATTTMSSQAMLASKGATTATIQKLIPAIQNIAAANHESLKQATSDVMKAIFNTGKTSSVGKLTITGSTQAERINQITKKVRDTIGSAAKDQASTPTGKIKVALNSLSESLTKVLQAATPVFSILASGMKKLSLVIDNLVTKHKTFVKILIGVTAAVVALVAAQVVFGAIAVGASVAMNALNIKLIANKVITSASRAATIAWTVAMSIAKAAMIAFKIVTINTADIQALWAKRAAISTAVTKAWTASVLVAKSVTRGLSFVFNSLRYSLVADIVKVIAMKTAFIAARTAMIAWKAIVMAARIATLAWTAVIWAFNTALYANPIGVVILLIVALIAVVIAVISHWKTVKKVFFEVCNSIHNFIHTYIVKPLKDVITFIVGKVLGTVAKLLHYLSYVPGMGFVDKYSKELNKYVSAMDKTAKKRKELFKSGSSLNLKDFSSSLTANIIPKQLKSGQISNSNMNINHNHNVVNVHTPDGKTKTINSDNGGTVDLSKGLSTMGYAY